MTHIILAGCETLYIVLIAHQIQKDHENLSTQLRHDRPAVLPVDGGCINCWFYRTVVACISLSAHLPVLLACHQN